MKNSEITKQFLDMINEAETQYPIAFEKVGECDKATQDILHKLEFGNLSYGENCKLMTKLKEIRKDRRYYKDIVESCAIVCNFKLNNNKSINVLTNSLGEMRKVEKYHDTRKYVPRVIREEK